MPISTISPEGQVTLPARMRRQLGMKPRDRVAIDVVEDAIVIKRAVNFFGLRGFLGRTLPPEEARRRMEEGVAKHVLDTQQ